MRFLILILLSLPLFSVAQNTDCYVVKVEGDTLKGSELLYSDMILKEPIFKLDDQSLQLQEVRLVRNNHGVFANVSSLNRGKNQFAMRVLNGKISILEAVDMRIYGANELPRWFDATQERRFMASGRMSYYMNEAGQAKMPNYQNLKLDLGSNAVSTSHLKKMRGYQWIKRSMIGSGGALLATRLWSMQGGFMMSPGLLIGALLTGGGFLFDNPINDEKWMAVEAYND